MNASREAGIYPLHTDRGGKWLIFGEPSWIDAIWIEIRDATRDGLLGGLSKVRTGMANQSRAKLGSSVICVYTYDWRDRDDVMTVREELRRLGITQQIPYKADEDTRAGKYAALGDEGHAKYFE